MKVSPANRARMSALTIEALAVAQARIQRHLAIQKAARTDPRLASLYAIWLLAADTSEDEPSYVLNDVITRIEQLAKLELAL